MLMLLRVPVVEGRNVVEPRTAPAELHTAIVM